MRQWFLIRARVLEVRRGSVVGGMGLGAPFVLGCGGGVSVAQWWVPVGGVPVLVVPGVGVGQWPTGAMLPLGQDCSGVPRQGPGWGQGPIWWVAAWTVCTACRAVGPADWCAWAGSAARRVRAAHVAAVRVPARVLAAAVVRVRIMALAPGRSVSVRGRVGRWLVWCRRVRSSRCAASRARTASGASA